MTYEEFYMEQARLAEKLKKEKQVVKLCCLKKRHDGDRIIHKLSQKIPVEVRKTLAAWTSIFITTNRSNICLDTLIFMA